MRRCPRCAQPRHARSRLRALRAPGAWLTSSLCAPPPPLAARSLARSLARSQVGRVCKDQITEYAGRKGIQVKEAEKWLGPYLAYDDNA